MVSLTGLSNNPVQKELLLEIMSIMERRLDDYYDHANFLAALEKTVATVKDAFKCEEHEKENEGQGIPYPPFEKWVEHAKRDWKEWDIKNDKPINSL